ncbi:hypothetical protein ACP70R_017435 [Stipagrostis hirtigluma subsp. patula]
MGNPNANSTPFRDITNSNTATRTDEAQRKRERERERARERRAMMSEEQREERNRKQREYRARKKAEGYNLNNMNPATGIQSQASNEKLTPSTAGSCSTVVPQSAEANDPELVTAGSLQQSNTPLQNGDNLIGIGRTTRVALSCIFISPSMDIELKEAEADALEVLEHLFNASARCGDVSDSLELLAEADVEQEPCVGQIDSFQMQKESIEISSDIEILEHTQNSSSSNQKEDLPIIAISCHNKPKKAHIAQIVPEDYICTKEDVKIIEYIKSLPNKGTLVEIGDAFIDKIHMECLFHDDMKLNGDVISAYIHCIRDEEHLLYREDGKVFLENTYISSILKRDGAYEISYKADTIASRIFLPINIEETHWYLTVINSRKREIQVLDSIGKMDRTDLKTTLIGLQRHINLVAQHKELNRHNWKDLEVATWPVVEMFEQPMQIDRDDVKNFRFKLPAILWASRLNTRKGYEQQEQTTEEKDSPSDVEILDAPDGVSNPSTTSQHVQSDTSLCIISHGISPTKICVPSRGVSPAKRLELLDALCGYIMLIDHPDYLEKEWIRITKPYPISLSLKKLQDILNVNKPMDSDCFNMAIRMFACDEALFMLDNKMHYMDLKFWEIIEVERDPRCRAKLDVERLAKLFEEWPDMDYCISDCKNVSHFILFILDMEARSVLILGPRPIPAWFKGIHADMYYIHKVHYIANNVKLAMEVVNPTWNDDIYVWRREVPTWVPQTKDWNMTGFLVFHFMCAWDGSKLASDPILLLSDHDLS